jgi:hypothetical protein
MAISTVKKDQPKGVDKKARLLELKEYHAPLLEKLGIEEPFFVTAMAHKPKGKDSKHISLFPSQMKRNVDIYMEFTDKDNVPEDPARKLYKWKHNPFWIGEYDSVEIEGSTDLRYLIPVAELVVVEDPTAGKQGVQSFQSFDEIMDPDMDAAIDQMTIRDFVAILRGKPVSRKKWLNDLLK